MSTLDWLVDLLGCPGCGGALTFRAAADDLRQGVLVHEHPPCEEAFPVIDGIPRLLVGGHRATLVRRHASWFERDAGALALGRRWSAETATEDAVVSGFDYEWSRYSATGTEELGKVFGEYFDLVDEERFASTAIVLDAGCGAGRWAVEVAARGPRVVAMDLGYSVDVAQRNAGSDRIAFVQADVHAVPLRAGAVDWAYSLGVLHHVAEPARALGSVVRAIRPGGLALIYLYYALDGRPFPYRIMFRVVDLARRVVSRLPRSAAHAFATAVALVVYLPLARLSRLLHAWGLKALADQLPLSFYRGLPFRIMRNDSLDRFGTQVEQRFTREAMRALLGAAGLTSIRFSPQMPFWHAVGAVSGR